jgi:hypothetical protein
VILKYFQRGFGTVINKKEAKNIIEYVNNSDTWPAHVMPAQMQGRWNAARRWAKMQIYNCTKLIFNPSQSKVGIWHDLKCDTLHIVKELEWNTKRDNRDGYYIYPNSYSRSKMSRRIKDPEKINKIWARNYDLKN